MAERETQQWWHVAGLVVVVLVAAVLRFTYPAWDALEHAHPDERYILWVATTVKPPPGYALTDGLGPLLDREAGGLNPFWWPPDARTSGVSVPKDEARSFAYGHLPLYLIAGSGQVLAWLGEVLPVEATLLNSEGLVAFLHLTYVGRALSALASTVTVVLAYVLGLRLFGAHAGLLGAALQAVLVQSIQLAHFATFDVVLTTFGLAMLVFAVRYAQGQRASDIVLAAVCGGLAVGSKFSAVLLGLAGLAALLMHEGRWSRRNLTLAGVALVVGAVTFAVTNPFALIEWRAFFVNVSRQGTMVRGGFDWNFVLQYRGTWPFVYPFVQQGNWLWGWPLTILAWAGLAWAVAQVWRTRDAGLATVLAWTLPYLVTTGLFVVKFPRYYLPLAPVMVVLGAGLVVEIGRRQPRWAAALGGMTLAFTAAWALAFVSMYRTAHPWVAASAWVYDNVPAGAVVVTEAADDVLPLNFNGRPVQRDATYEMRALPVQARPDDEAKLAEMAETLAAGEWLIIATNRNYSVLPRFPGRYPLTSRYYAALFAERLGYTLVAQFEREPALLGLTLRHDPWLGLEPAAVFEAGPPGTVPWAFADESFTVYDHPRVMVLRNTGGLSAEEIVAAVSGVVASSNAGER